MKFKKNNSATLEGKIETPVVWEKHHNPTIEDHAGSVAPGDVVQTMDFDFDALDKDTAAFFANANPDVRCESAMALALILGWIWQSGFESAQCKFAAMTAGLRPDLLDDASYEEIGSKLGCVKATIAKAARNFQKQFNIKFSRSRQDDARARMAEAARGHGWRDTRKRARGQAQPPTPL
ncbi:MAG TPA: hypothetical protein VFC85_03405 [Verrucomicrobiae bacterium]|nr:hypothetical protein [Verrucomicrobiae bacterium]